MLFHTYVIVSGVGLLLYAVQPLIPLRLFYHFRTANIPKQIFLVMMCFVYKNTLNSRLLEVSKISSVDTYQGSEDTVLKSMLHRDLY